MPILSPTVITGTPYQIGFGLGVLARPAFDPYMAQNEAWLELSATANRARAMSLLRITQSVFPEYLEEVRGLAHALSWSVDDMFLWQCRGEFLSRTRDGCSTLACRTNGGMLIAHNEDGDPFLVGNCPMVDVRPAGKPGFHAFLYPGSIPGHTFAATNAGLVQTINNVRASETRDGVPRIFLCRAVLDAGSLDAAMAILNGSLRAGSYHHTLAMRGDSRLFSIEAIPSRCSVIQSEAAHVHSNHLVHPVLAGEKQVITCSSLDRQKRLNVLMQSSRGVLSEQDILGAMFDRSNDGLPIYREDSDDPDHENTLATAVIKIFIDEIKIDVYVSKALTYSIDIPSEMPS
ncbi:C45 family peptidase [Caballeronia sp. GAFFF2]|uniref:C45 family autoproteolytic acyltransferase/hydolase n=1 Tax=Caballeronia sp. GAFFF2 TaxID=2921741 RepID=UPI002027A901|nr:C45 family peptidase [Caballeronia sp. GAFFF2]